MNQLNLSEILELKFPQISFKTDVILQDDGQGPYIKEWNIPGVAKPTQADLDQWAIELAPIKQTLDARAARRDAYPAIGDQLDMLYKAMVSGILPKVPDFYNAIKSVKEANPL